MKKLAEVKEFNQLFLPAAAVLAVGLTAGIILAILVVQRVMDSAGPKQLESKQTVSDNTSAVSKPIDTINTALVSSHPVEPATSTPKPKPAPKPTPTPAPAAKFSVNISGDGCSVTALGAPGMQLTAGATNGRKGGEVTYTLPSSGKLTVSAGGIQGFSSYAYLYDLSGSLIASTTGTIAPEQCDPPLVP